MASPRDTSPAIVGLPAELIEQVLINSAEGGFPSAVAWLAQTCKHFSTLIYHASDQHLWREIYLTTFDDPRHLLSYLARAGPNGPASDLSENNSLVAAFDWASEFKQRMRAAKHAQSLAYRQGNDETSSLAATIKSFLSVISTSAPFPRSYPPHLLVPPRASIFPPLIHLLTSLPDWQPSLDTDLFANFQSHNCSWITETLAQGYPASLAQHLYNHTAPMLAAHSEWDDTEEGRLFYKLVFFRSFIPVAPTLSVTGEPQELASPTLPASTETQASDSSNVSLSPSEQRVAARRLARKRVYNLGFLSPRRYWGPFLRTGPPPVLQRRPHSDDPQPSTSSAGGSLNNPVYTISEVDYEDDDDSEYAPDEDDSDTELSIHDILPLIAPYTAADFDLHHETNATFIFPPPHRVVPDYAFLAAARIILEENFRDSMLPPVIENTVGRMSEQLLEALSSVEFVRMGGAPEFWRAWIGGGREEEAEEGDNTGKRSSSKGKAKVNIDTDADVNKSDAVEGWDWAGVTGEWRRSVCWLDYRDLLLYNLGSNIPDESIEETIRIFPLALRAAGYSKPPERDPLDTITPADSLLYRLPIIHVEGETWGSDVDEGNLRHVKGFVRMIGDGAVRWSLTSSHADSPEAEWVTEGVQVGAIGSAAGVIGMWTGAEHIRSDPLGPFWAWKVR